MLALEWVVVAFYTLDILLRFLRVLPNVGNCTHIKIAKAYIYSGMLFVDILATFPFNIFDTRSPEDSQSVSALSLLKLLRLTKLPLVLKVLHFEQFETIINFFYRPKTRKRKDIVSFRISCKKQFRILRLIVAVFFVAYFGANLWYAISKY